MRTFKMVLAGVILLSIIIGTIGCSTVRPDGAATDFTLTGLDGETYSLSEYEGSPVVLNFFATWCGPCQAEVPHLQAFYTDQKWQDEGIMFLAINLQESTGLVQQFMDHFGLTFPVLMDTDGSVGKDYNVSGIPATFFIDENGIISNIKTGAFTSLAELESMLDELVAGE